MPSHAHLCPVLRSPGVALHRYLLPFLAVIESPATTGPMTGVALSSLHKFLLYGFIRKDYPRVKEGITLVAQVSSLLLMVVLVAFVAVVV